MKKRERDYRRLALAFSLASALLYSFWLAGYALNPTTVKQLDLSALQASGQPFSSLFVLGDILTGLGIMVAAYFVNQFWRHSPVAQRKVLSICLSGLLLFGIMTAVSSLLPSCIANSRVCDTHLSQVLDPHDVTGGIAAIGLFVAGLGAIQLLDYKKTWLGHSLGAVLLGWLISGTLFVWLSVTAHTAGLFMQRVWLLLSSLLITLIFIAICNPVAGVKRASRNWQIGLKYNEQKP